MKEGLFANNLSFKYYLQKPLIELIVNTSLKTRTQNYSL
jgi:hypothetical protein